MESQDLIGRPLVPFFDSDENVNDLLQFAERDNEREEMKIDARVWDKELGYFVYPSEQQMATSTLVAIATETRGTRIHSGSKLLLTPSMMLSSSAPNSLAADGSALQAISVGTRPRSSSVKRGSKLKTGSNTPGRRLKENEGVEDVSAANNFLSKKGKNKGSNTTSNSAQSSNSQQSRNGKQKEQLSASGKWAWSAFQSSPDPTELPMPPFFIKPTGGLSDDNESLSVMTSALPSPPRTPPSAPYSNAPILFQLPPGSPPAQAPQPSLPPPTQTPQPPLPPPAQTPQSPLPRPVQASQPPLPPPAQASQPPLPQSPQPPLPPPAQALQPPLPPMPTAPPEVKTTTSISIELSMTEDLRRMLNIGGG